jgi:hypothetical protein
MFLTCLFVSGCLKNDIVVDDKLVIINVEHGLVDQLDFFVVGERIKKWDIKLNMIYLGFQGMVFPIEEGHPNLFFAN